MHDKFEFLSWVAEPWTEVSDGSMFPVHLAIWLHYSVVSLIVSESCVYPSLDGLKLSFRALLKIFDLVKGAKSRLRISVASMAGSPRFLNFGFYLRTELARLACMLGYKSATISPRTIFTPTFSIHDKSEFLSWVAEPWTEVSNGLMFPVHLAKLEVLPWLGLKTPSLTSGVRILMWFRIVLSGDVQSRMFLLTPTLLHA